ncbi:proton gradient regulation 5 protein [Pseudoscourfieldia marina]
MASSLSFSRSSAVAGARPMARRPPVAAPRRGQSSRAVRTVAGNSAEDGIFTPIVKVTRNIMGAKEFNKLRGKGISLHSQVITEFCKQIGADNKRKQGLIRQAKKNGEKLGFLS